MDPVTVGLLGWGNFSSHIHEETLRRLIAEGRCTVGSVCVRTLQTRQDIMARLGAAGGTDDYHAVLADPTIDAVIIGAPHQAQARMAIDALAAGKYVYVEKPTFAEEEETGRPARAFYDEFVALGSCAKSHLAVGLNKRFAPAYAELRQLCREQWGGTRYLQVNVVDDAWRWNAGRYPEGFLLWLDVAHWLDLARWFTGAEVTRLSCLSPQPEDSLITMAMSDGSAVSVFLSGNVTMDVMKEELRVVTAARRSAVVTDFLEMEIFGGPQRELRRYPANQQSGGDPAYVAAIDAGGLEAFRALRRTQFERFEAVRERLPEGDDEVRCNIPNFMRPQGWRESLRSFIDAVADGRAVSTAAGFTDAYIAYGLLDTIRDSLAHDGQLVPATAHLSL